MVHIAIAINIFTANDQNEFILSRFLRSACGKYVDIFIDIFAKIFLEFGFSLSSEF